MDKGPEAAPSRTGMKMTVTTEVSWVDLVRLLRHFHNGLEDGEADLSDLSVRHLDRMQMHCEGIAKMLDAKIKERLDG